jgi:hypothetical protein
MRYQILYAARDEGQAGSCLGAEGRPPQGLPSNADAYVQLYGR